MSVPRTILEAWNGKKSFLKLTFPYLVAAAAPMDLRSVVDNDDELDMLIATACVYDGMRVWVESEQKLYIYCLLDNGGYGFKPFADSFTAAEVERLKTIRHIQGKPFNGQQDVESGLVYPEQITIPEDKTLYDILTTTACIKSGDNRPTLQPGFYYWQDTDSGKYIALIVERLGAEIMVDDTTLVNNESVTLRVDKSTYKYTLTTIDNGALIMQYGVSSYAAGQGGETHTRTVEWITAPTRLSDATNDAAADASKGVAATPKAVAAKADLTDLAPAWSKNSAYSVGEYVTYGGDLYRCKVEAVAANTDWSTTNFAKVAVGAELIAEAAARKTADATLQTNIDNEATARENADATLLSVLGFDNSNVYYGVNNSTSKNFNVSWKTTPLRLAVGDYVVLKFNKTYTQDIQYVSLIVGNYSYNIDAENGASSVNTINAGTTIIYKCTGLSSLTTYKIGRYDVIPKGMIVMWSGSTVPDGWALCDGTNGTPNLSDKFIVGAGSTFTKGNHTGVTKVTLQPENLPPHRHVFIGDANIANNQTLGVLPLDDKTYNLSADGTGVARKYLTDSRIYNRDLGGVPTVATALTPNSFDTLPPYYALAFIMFKG